MKKISEYINGLDYLDNQILTHANISIAFNSGDYFRNPQYFTFESIGVFKDCKKIVKYLMDYIRHNVPNINPGSTYNIASKDIDNNLFFNQLKLHFRQTGKKGVTGSYYVGKQNPDEQLKYDKLRWNDKQNKFDFIEIEIDNVSDFENDETAIAVMLTHELTHAYEDYMIRSKNNAYTSGLHKSYFKGSVSDIQKEFEKILGNASKNGVNVDVMDQLLYMLNKPEVNAYLAELDVELGNKMFKDAKEALEYISKNSIPYGNYKYVFNIFNSGQYDNQLESMGFKKSSLNTLRKVSRDTWTKIVNHIYNIILDHIQFDVVTENCFIKIEDVNKKIYER